MLIDWYTVAAQALNFLILVWLLKRFLYRPVLDSIDARERLIAAELADAAAKQAAAVEQREEFTRKNQDFDRQRASLLGKLTDEAKSERQRLLEEARHDADAVRTRLQDALHNEQQIMSGEITRRAREEVFAIARKVLADLATTGLEETMVRAFIDRIRTLNGADRKVLAAAFETAPSKAVVRSAFDLSADQRTAIEKVLGEVRRVPPPLRFELAPELVSGIDLTVSGQKLAWSIADYLDELEKNVGALLEVRAPQSVAKPPSAAKSEPVRAAGAPVAAAAR